MSVKKLVIAPVAECLGADINNYTLNNNNNFKLLWFKGKLNEQLFDFLLDCGASTCCIAKSCVSSNPIFKNLPKLPYSGPGLVDVNGKPLVAENVISLKFCIGSPEISMQVDFVIVSDLPYSCIMGVSFLNMLKKLGCG